MRNFARARICIILSGVTHSVVEFVLTYQMSTVQYSVQCIVNVHVEVD